MSNNNGLAPINTSQSTRNGLQKKRIWKWRGILVVAAIVLAVSTVVLGWYISDRSNRDNKLTTKTRAYSFDENRGNTVMAQHTLQGNLPGAGMKFSSPRADFLYADAPLYKSDTRQSQNKIVDRGDHVELGQRIVKPDGKVFHQAVLAARIVPPAEQSEFSSYNYFSGLLNTLVFNKSRDSTDVGLGLSPPTKFTNGAIRDNANIFEFAAALPNGVTSGPIDHIVGQIIEIKGKNANYYLMISAIDENWNSSPKTWQAIKDSIKVDQ